MSKNNLENKDIKTLHETINKDDFNSLEGEALTTFFKVMSNLDRLRIIKILLSGSHYMYQIKDMINISQSSLSQQIDKLEYAGLVEIKKEGRKVLCSLKKEKVKKLHNSINQFMKVKTQEVLDTEKELLKTIEIKEEIEKL